MDSKILILRIRAITEPGWSLEVEWFSPKSRCRSSHCFSGSGTADPSPREVRKVLVLHEGAGVVDEDHVPVLVHQHVPGVAVDVGDEGVEDPLAPHLMYPVAVIGDNVTARAIVQAAQANGFDDITKDVVPHIQYLLTMGTRVLAESIRGACMTGHDRASLTTTYDNLVYLKNT